MADSETKEFATGTDETTASQSRAERFKALQARRNASSRANHNDVIAEHKRMKLDPAQLSKLDRKKAEAEMKLAKQDAEEAGDDYERKRAWDWTMEESLAWDERLAKKQANRDQAGFAGNPYKNPIHPKFPSFRVGTDWWLDYTQAAEKTYKLQLKGIKPDLEAYQKAKEEALGQSGQLVQMADGGLVGVDEDRKFFADANSLGITDHKPSKAAVDRLAEQTKKRLAEQEAKRRKKRTGGDDDVSYINQRNKVFNQKLARYVLVSFLFLELQLMG
jgi:pre-mRNA-splicing factor SYF2